MSVISKTSQSLLFKPSEQSDSSEADSVHDLGFIGWTNYIVGGGNVINKRLVWASVQVCTDTEMFPVLLSPTIYVKPTYLERCVTSITRAVMAHDYSPDRIREASVSCCFNNNNSSCNYIQMFTWCWNNLPLSIIVIIENDYFIPQNMSYYIVGLLFL